MRLSKLVRVSLGLLAFNLADPATSTGQSLVKEEVSIVERGPHHKVIRRVSWLTNTLGVVSARTNSYTEIATGMHFWRDGQWVETKAEIELLADGAAATNGPHKVFFAANLNTAGAVDLAMPDGKRLRSHILGLSYFDVSANKAVLIAQTKDSIGLLVGKDQVLYPNAFDDVSADVQYIYSTAGMEQNLIWRGGLPPPEEFHLDPAKTMVQVLTEFYDPPVPVQTATSGRAAERDTILNFGAMQIGSGQAFAIGEAGQTADPIPVRKQWTVLEGRTFLVEEVPFTRVAGLIETLGATKPGASLNRNRQGAGANVIAALTGSLPKAPAGRTKGKMKLAQLEAKPRPGFVLDYTILLTQNNFTFSGDTTYFVTNTVNLTGTTRIEAGSVVKFAAGTRPAINITGTVDCRTSMYRPAVFTAKDDNTVGETFGTGNPGSVKYGSGLTFSTSGMALNYLRFSYANSAVTLNFASGLLSMTNIQFVQCSAAVDYYGNGENTVMVDNSLFYAMTDVVTGGYDNHLRGNHLTVNQCSQLASYMNGASEIHLTNSIFADVEELGSPEVFEGSHNGFFNSPTFGDSIIPPPPLGANPFQTIGAASHYLADDSYRNKGTVDIPASLLSNIKLRTTYPPIPLVNNFTMDTVISLRPEVRDAEDQPALGYHYDPLDYVVSGLTVSANLILTGGVALGTYGSSSSYGLGLSSGRFVSEGTSTRLNWIVRYNTVQEQSTTTWSASSVGASVKKISSSPVVKTRFTGWSLLGGTGDHFYDDTGSASPPSFSHSQYGGGNFMITPGSVALTNCVWERVHVTLYDVGGDPQWYLFNNLFYGGSLYYEARNEGSPVMLAYDNLFDKTGIESDGASESFTHGTNGYVDVAHLSGTSSGGDKDITWPADYLAGPLGNYYYPTTGGNLSQLIDAGSRTAVAAGLAQYTTRTDQTPDSGDVDIGFHYKAPPPCDNPTIEGWVFTDEGFIAGGQIGIVKRAYTYPSDVPASPWSFPASSATIGVGMGYENDDNCRDSHGPPYNPNIQTATAEGGITVGSGCQAGLTVNWSGRIEVHDPGYDRMWLYLDGNQIGYAESTQDPNQQGCDPMAEVTGTVQRVLGAGTHLLKIKTDTGTDGQYQNEAYYRFDITLEQN